MGIEITFGRREGQREDISLPRAIVDAIEKSVGSLNLRTVIEETDPPRQYAIYAPRILDMPPRTAVALIQWRMARELLDLTWAQAFEAYIDMVRRRFGWWRNQAPTWGGELWRAERAVRQAAELLSRAEEAYEEWLAKSRECLTSDLREWYQWRVDGAYNDEAFIREMCTEYGGRRARSLKPKLDSDVDVVELRTRLQIPAEGFHDAEQAADWLHDRLPLEELEAPDGPLESGIFHIYHGFDAPIHIQPPCWLVMWGTYPVRTRIPLLPETPTPAYGGRTQVPVLVEATHRLRKKHRLKSDWNEVLSIYLLRGELRPPISCRRWREQPVISERNAYLLDLLHRHSDRHTQIIHNSGLSEKEFLEIARAHPGVNDAKLEYLCLKAGDEKGCLPKREISLDVLYQTKSRWGWSEMAF